MNMPDEKYVGIVEDPRSPEQKDLDYKHEDIAQGDIVLNWKEKTEAEWKKFLIRNQDGSSACVAFATAKLLGIGIRTLQRKLKQYREDDQNVVVNFPAA